MAHQVKLQSKYELRVVENLGSSISEPLNINSELNKRIVKAAVTLWRLAKRVLQNPNLKVSIKTSVLCLSSNKHFALSQREIDILVSLETVKTRKLKWFVHTTRSQGLSAMCLQGIAHEVACKGRPKKKWGDSIKEWTGLSLAEVIRAAECCMGWRGLVREGAK